MKKFYAVLSYFTIGLNALLLFLIFFSDKITVSPLLQSAGRLHPMLLHLPIGFFIIFLLMMTVGISKKSYRKSARLVLNLTAFLVVIAAVAGLLLSREGGYNETVLTRHTVTAVLLSISVGVLSQLKNEWLVSRPAAMATWIVMGLVVVTGHFGAELTHGENYVLAPLQKDVDENIPQDSTVYSLAVAPVIKSKCGSCHSPSKKKGDLILTTLRGIEKGGKHGAVILAGKSAESELMKRIWLPMEQDEHMPPKDKAQLTSAESLLLKYWIDHGAAFDLKADSLPEQDSLRILASLIASQKKSSDDGKQRYAFDFIPSETLRKLNSPTISVSQISTTEPALKAGFFLAQYFKIEDLKALGSVKDNIIELNLAGMPIGDESVKEIRQFKNLESLNLNNTRITDKAVAELISMKMLTELKLAGTAISASGLEQVAKSKTIKEVFVWNTRLSGPDLKKLQEQFTAVRWNHGYQPDASEVLTLTAPILKNESYLLDKSEGIVLKHNLPGTTIRYTLDGSQPDSLTSTAYSSPVVLNKHGRLRAIAIKEGWLKSSEVNKPFFVKGSIPRTSNLLSTTNKDYKAKGASTLIDHNLGDPDNFRDGNTLGFRETKWMSTFSFAPDSLPTEITIIYLQNIGSFVMPPETLEVWTGTTDGNLKLYKRMVIEQPTKYEQNEHGSVTISLDKPASIIKLVGNPVSKLPAWHYGKGQKGWLMVSEVIFR
jgi:uncharacterized membrane protein